MIWKCLDAGSRLHYAEAADGRVEFRDRCLWALCTSYKWTSLIRRLHLAASFWQLLQDRDAADPKQRDACPEGANKMEWHQWNGKEGAKTKTGAGGKTLRTACSHLSINMVQWFWKLTCSRSVPLGASWLAGSNLKRQPRMLHWFRCHRNRSWLSWLARAVNQSTAGGICMALGQRWRWEAPVAETCLGGDLRRIQRWPSEMTLHRSCLLSLIHG